MKRKFRAHWSPSGDADANAARVLPDLLRHFFEHGDRVVRPRTSEKRLHEFRLDAKHTRYALELFEPLYGAAVRPHLEGIKKVQQVLGQLNDCQATLQLLDEMGVSVEKDWREAIETRRDKKRGEFAKLWLDEFEDGTRRETWIAKLERPGAHLVK